MKLRKIQLSAASMVLVALILISQSGIAQAMSQEPQKILADTSIGKNPFIEGLELIAAEGSSLIAQYYQLGGEKLFPLNPETTAFNSLDILYIISSNQENWRDYWPRSIWEFRDGATVVMQFSQGMDDSLDDADEIVSSLNSWLGTTMDVLYGVYDSISEKTTLFYWGYMSAENHTDFIYDEFYDVMNTGGYTNFITNDVIASSPVSVVGTGLIKDETEEWVPLTVAAFIQEDGIDIDGNGVHNMSVANAFDYSGTIHAAPNSIISAINFQLPYVANVYDLSPETTNLYPELTGKFDWLMKYTALYAPVYDDIYVTYDMAVEELTTFPQITGDLSVDVAALHDPNDPVLNYTIELTNTGDETAYDSTFIWDIGEEPSSEYLTIFDDDTYTFDDSIEMYWNYTSGELVNTDPNNPTTLIFKGWFKYKDETVVPVPSIEISPTNYQPDLEAAILLLYTEKEFFKFSNSSNIFSYTLDNGNYALAGTIDELAPGESETFWWAISDLPGEDDPLFIPGFDIYNETMTEYNITFCDNTSAYGYGDSLSDLLVKMSLDEGSDLRYPPIGQEFIPGVMFVYSDDKSREYFGWSNGLIIQLYDDEAILKTTVELNSSTYKIDDVAQIDVTIENIGDADATYVQIQGFHAQVDSQWQITDIQAFSEETIIDSGIIPKNGGIATHTFYRDVKTFLGIHPVVISVDYVTEESEGYDGPFNRTDINNVMSNLLIAIVLPNDDKAGEDEPSYPTPIVNVSVSWYDENGGFIENGDLIEIRTEVKNLGDEATTIKLFSYFPTRMASIDPYANYYNGHNYKVTDGSGNIIDPSTYSQAFAFDHPDWPITIAAIEGLHLAPGATIVFYYKLTVEDAESLILPPVHVEYTSRYPMAGTSGMEGASSGEDGGGSFPLTAGISIGLETSSVTTGIRFSIKQSDAGSSSWTSYSGSSLMTAYSAVTPHDTSTSNGGGVNGFTTLTGFMRNNMILMIVVLAIPVIVLAVRERRR